MNHEKIIAPIVPRMYDSFVSVEEPLLMKQLVYRMYRKHIRLTKPRFLSMLYLDRNGGKRGIENRDELVAHMQNVTGTKLVIQPNKPMSFREQVEFVWDKDIYISVHGAAMTHILFMEPLGALIEFNPPNFREPFYRNMAIKTQLLYYGIFSTWTKDMKVSMSLQQTEKKLNQWFTVPMELFAKTLAMAVENVWKLKYKTVRL